MAQNWFLGVLKPAEHELDNEKFLGCRIEGLQVDFQKISILPEKKITKKSHDV